MNIKLIRAFIASPSGLEAERRAAFAAAGEINKSVAIPMGGRLELIGWEETLSGNGRPQAIINAEMETCDLFIGAIWTSWGSKPAIDGLYSSGFEEEFELSRARHRRSGNPTMAMFFKTIDPIHARDPGKDLEKVLSFQEKLRAEKSFLYGTFENAEDFALKVREFLSTHVIRLLKQPSAQQDERAIEAVVREHDGGDALPEVSPDRAPDAIFLNSAASGILSDSGLGPVDIARMRLIGTAYGKSENDKQVLGVHDANLIYGARKRFELSFIERYGLLEAGLSKIGAENVPVWTWLAGMTQSRLDVLIGISVFGEPAEQVGAITAMRLLRLAVSPIATVSEDPIGHNWLGADTPSAVKVAALRYLRDLGSIKELPLVQRELELASKDTSTAALETAITIIMRSSEQEAVRYALTTSFETLDTGLIYKVLDHLDEASIQELKTGLDHRSPVVRSASLREMSRRDAIDMATLERAQADDAPLVRYAALQALDRLGQSLSLDEAQKILGRPKPSPRLFGLVGSQDTAGLALFELYATERMRVMSVQSLEVLVGTSAHRVSAYQTLAARRIGSYGEQLRADLRNGFEAYFAANWPEGIKPAMSPSALALAVGSTDPAERKKRELIWKALDIVAVHRDVNDLSLVRKVLDDGNASISALVINFLKAIGNQEDIERLGRTPRLRVAQPDDGDYFRDFIDAARLILKLHEGTSSMLMKLDFPPIMKAKLIELMPAKDFATLADNEIMALLLSDDDDIRRATARKAPTSITRTRLVTILESYWGDEGGRYYIVTHWLDLGLAYGRAAARRVVDASADR